MLVLLFTACSKFSTLDQTPTSPNSDAGSIPQTDTSLTLHWYGPDHADDFEKFGGITGYHIHWSASPIAASMTGTCGNILNEFGRPDDKYDSRIEVLGTNSGCKSNVIVENVPGQAAYGKTLRAHECIYKVTGLPESGTLYFVISPFMGNPNEFSTQWWGCAIKEFPVTLPSQLKTIHL